MGFWLTEKYLMYELAQSRAREVFIKNDLQQLRKPS